MGRFLIALAAVLSVIALLAIALAPDGPIAQPLGADPASAPPPRVPLLQGRAVVPATAEPTLDEVLAEADEAIDEDIAFVLVDEKDAPPDPVQTGDCTLVLLLTSDRDDKPFDTDLELWRIDEPGNKHWLAGDRKIADLETKDGRATATDLAAGRYRIHADVQREGSKDPVAFDVAGAETTVALKLPAPRRFQVRLRIYDHAGQFVYRGAKQSGGASSYSSFGGSPDWVQRRGLRDGVLNRSMIGGGGCGSSGGRGRHVPVEAENGTFAMLTMRASERTRSWSRTMYLHPEEGTRVSLHARSRTARDCTFVGATLPLRELHEAIRLPDGTRAIEAGARIRASCSAVLVPESGVEPDWRALPIAVTVRLEGYAKLEFTHTLARPIEDRTLVPHVE